MANSIKSSLHAAWCQTTSRYYSVSISFCSSEISGTQYSLTVPCLPCVPLLSTLPPFLRCAYSLLQKNSCLLFLWQACFFSVPQSGEAKLSRMLVHSVESARLRTTCFAMVEKQDTGSPSTYCRAPGPQTLQSKNIQKIFSWVSFVIHKLYMCVKTQLNGLQNRNNPVVYIRNHCNLSRGGKDPQPPFMLLIITRVTCSCSNFVRTHPCINQNILFTRAAHNQPQNRLIWPSSGSKKASTSSNTSWWQS